MTRFGTAVVYAAATVGLAMALAACSPRQSGDRPEAQYDSASGRLRRLAFDSTQNGRNDAVGIMDGARVERIEVDENEDGQTDRWEFYGSNSRLERAGFSRRGNGLMDAVATYGADGTVARVEISTRGDGRFDRHEFYLHETLARVEEDVDGDGRIDKWETYKVDSGMPSDQSSSILMAAFDEYARGTPSRRLVYRPDGSVLREEVDPDGDGTFVALAGTRRQ